MTNICFITKKSLYESNISSPHQDHTGLSVVKITNSQDHLEYIVSNNDWKLFCRSQDPFLPSEEKQFNFKQFNFNQNEIIRLKAFIYNRNRKKETPNISLYLNEDCTLKNDIPEIPSVHDRAMILLEYFVEMTKMLGEYITVTTPMTLVSYSVNLKETFYLLDYLKKIKHIDEYGQNNFIVMPGGFEKAEKLKTINLNSKEAFMIMPFHKILNKLSDSIEKVINKTGYKPIRIDKNLDNKKIDDQIIVHINRSRFVVCDLTSVKGQQNGNVYFEVGYAMGRKIEIIWTCEEKSINTLPFDIRQYRCTGWNKNNLLDFEEKLEARILSIIGDIQK